MITGFITAVAAMTILVLILALAYALNPHKRPLPTESDYTYHRAPWFQLYYSSKYLNPVKRGDRKGNLEALFSEMKKPEISPASDQINHLRLTAVGDLMSRADIVGEEGRAIWDHVGADVFSGDLSIGNLEFAVNPDWIIEKMLRYSLRPEQAEPFLGDPRFGSFDVLTLANNHLNDALSGGITSTCRYLDEKGITHVGANRTPEEQDQFPILDKNGIKIAVLAYSFTTNNIPLERDFGHGVNLVRFNALRDEDYDPSLIHKHIDLAHERGADMIVCCNHWGIEFEYYPPLRLIQRARDLMDRGVDIIIGHHPHILNPSEWYQSKDGRNCLCFYSLGNLTNHSMLRSVSAMSQIVDIEIEKGIDTGGRMRTCITDAQIKPTFFLGSFGLSRKKPRLIPLLETAREIEKGRPPAYLVRGETALIKRMAKEHRQWFRQEQAFSYK